MTFGIDPSGERFLTDLSQTRARAARAQNQISSGYRINRPSDDPEKVARLVSLQTDLERTEQIETNLGLFKMETDAAERALAAAVDVLDKVSVLGAQGASTTIGADKRLILSQQASAWLERLVAISNTSAGGRYLFSGDRDNVAPYTMDLTLASGVSIFSGSPATRQAEDLSGARFAVSHAADTVFEDSDAGIFLAVNQMRVALESDDTAGIQNALASLEKARAHLNGEHAWYGTVQNRISAELRSVQDHTLQINEEITGIRETDYVEASLIAVSAQTQEQASLAAKARMQSASLFDYLG